MSKPKSSKSLGWKVVTDLAVLAALVFIIGSLLPYFHNKELEVKLMFAFVIAAVLALALANLCTDFLHFTFSKWKLKHPTLSGRALDPRILFLGLAEVMGTAEPAEMAQRSRAYTSHFRAVIFAAIRAAGPTRDFDPSDDVVGPVAVRNLEAMKQGKRPCEVP